MTEDKKNIDKLFHDVLYNNEHDVPNYVWDNIKDVMLKEFAENRFASGLSTGIAMAGEQLKEHFPYQRDDINELPDEISFGDE